MATSANPQTLPIEKKAYYVVDEKSLVRIIDIMPTGGFILVEDCSDNTAVWWPASSLDTARKVEY